MSNFRKVNNDIGLILEKKLIFVLQMMKIKNMKLILKK